MKHSFEEAEFLRSCLLPQDFPKASYPEIAIVGRSNVGKSSLINHLLKRKGLAKTSSTPGKTQTINFFLIDGAFYLVDLPGYGFAKSSQETQKNWKLAIDDYLNNRTKINLFLLLLDIRHLPKETDIAFIQWATGHHIPLLLIFTKTDKVKKSESLTLATDILKTTTPYLPQGYPFDWTFFSIKDLFSRKTLIQKIHDLIDLDC